MELFVCALLVLFIGTSSGSHPATTAPGVDKIAELFSQIENDGLDKDQSDIINNDYNSVMCWQETINSVEYKNGTHNADRQFSIILETPGDLSNESLHDEFDGTKRSKTVNYTSTFETPKFLIQINKTLTCGVGKVIIKEFTMLPNGKKRIQLDLGSRKMLNNYEFKKCANLTRCTARKNPNARVVGEWDPTEVKSYSGGNNRNKPHIINVEISNNPSDEEPGIVTQVNRPAKADSIDLEKKLSSSEHHGKIPSHNYRIPSQSHRQIPPRNHYGIPPSLNKKIPLVNYGIPPQYNQTSPQLNGTPLQLNRTPPQLNRTLQLNKTPPQLNKKPPQNYRQIPPHSNTPPGIPPKMYRILPFYNETSGQINKPLLQNIAISTDKKTPSKNNATPYKISIIDNTEKILLEEPCKLRHKLNITFQISINHVITKTNSSIPIKTTHILNAVKFQTFNITQRNLQKINKPKQEDVNKTWDRLTRLLSRQYFFDCCNKIIPFSDVPLVKTDVGISDAEALILFDEESRAAMASVHKQMQKCNGGSV